MIRRWSHVVRRWSPSSFLLGMISTVTVVLIASPLVIPRPRPIPASQFSCARHIDDAIAEFAAASPAAASDTAAAFDTAAQRAGSGSWFMKHPGQRPTVPVELTSWRPDNFNLSRCCNDFKVYIYPVSYPDPDFDWTFGLDVDFKENWLYYSPPLRMWARRNRALVTSNPEEACLLIPAATATHLRGKCKDDHCERWAVGQWLQKLQYWDGGRNHAVFDQEDMWGLEDSGRQVSPGGRITSRLSKYATFDVSKAIALHNSADRRGIRLGFDLPVLRFFNNKARYVNNENLRRNSNREKLACMVGIYRDDMHFKVSRRAVHDLHNGNDIFVVTGLEEDVGSWKDLLPTCKFGLLPPGGSTFRSFRFLEVLSAGAVPVIVNTGGMMPYEHMVDWNALGVVIEEREIGLIPDILRSMSENDYLVKQRRTVKAYEYMFSTSERVIDTTIGFLKDEVARALREHGQEVCEQ